MNKFRMTLIMILIISFFSSIACADSEISILEKYFLEGRYEKAVSAAHRLIESRSRQRYEVYYLLGLSELKLNRFVEARQSFQDIIDKYPGSPRLFDAYVGIGDSYFLEGRTNSAVRTYNAILGRFPDDKNIAIVRSRISECSAKTSPQGKPVVAPRDIPRGEASSYISVQVGSFKNSRNAERVADKLSSAGFESFVEIPVGSADRLYRVKVGKLQSKESAETLAAKLRAKGYRTKICPAQ